GGDEARSGEISAQELQERLELANLDRAEMRKPRIGHADLSKVQMAPSQALRVLEQVHAWSHQTAVDTCKLGEYLQRLGEVMLLLRASGRHFNALHQDLTLCAQVHVVVPITRNTELMLQGLLGHGQYGDTLGQVVARLLDSGLRQVPRKDREPRVDTRGVR